MRSLVERLVACLGLLAGVGALVVSMASRTTVTVTLPVGADPVVGVEQALPIGNPPVEQAGAEGRMVWPVVAHRLRLDLRMDEAQAVVLDGALEICSENLIRAGRHPDALWRDRLEKRARCEAYDKVMAVLRREQQDDFKQWLKAPTHKAMTAWFERSSTGCCGGGQSDG